MAGMSFTLAPRRSLKGRRECIVGVAVPPVIGNWGSLLAHPIVTANGRCRARRRRRILVRTGSSVRRRSATARSPGDGQGNQRWGLPEIDRPNGVVIHRMVRAKPFFSLQTRHRLSRVTSGVPSVRRSSGISVCTPSTGGHIPTGAAGKWCVRLACHGWATR